ncbi:hypothetical protein AKJ09_06581 [Labilithrix luteola]|uniref:Uncharacterized protein n=1 Tax=Labilithrix luteola TaxID=1391654 RepID=A0A0K1Q2F8_9BACT|nr:hypothetical protein [Labilithrix luteola]AKU99917.1 hypothetical protein AKJ09_06581 [Labilithrix luteola]
MRAMLMVEDNLFNQQKSADARREAADKAEMEAAKKAVDSMREEANDTLKQAIVSGSIQMAASAAQGVSAGLSIRANDLNSGAKAFEKSANDALQKSSGEALKQSEQFARNAAEMSSKAQLMEHWAQGIKASADFVATTGGALSKGFDYELKQDQADKAQHDLDAKAANQRSQAYADFSRDAHDLATRTLQKLDEILQARNQTALAIIRA